MAVQPIVEGDAARARVAIRLSIEYFLRTAQMISNGAGGNLLSGVIQLAIIAGNVGYLDSNPEEPPPFASLDDVIPDSMRRPISVLGVAESLSLPYETTRKHIERLIEAGHCKRVKGGVIVPLERALAPGETEVGLANMANLRRLFKALIRAGVAFD